MQVSPLNDRSLCVVFEARYGYSGVLSYREAKDLAMRLAATDSNKKVFVYRLIEQDVYGR